MVISANPHEQTRRDLDEILFSSVHARALYPWLNAAQPNILSCGLERVEKTKETVEAKLGSLRNSPLQFFAYFGLPSIEKSFFTMFASLA